MTNQLRKLVIERAVNCCEYCQLDQADSLLTHEIEHVISRQHRGPTEASNLAFACFWCNRFKGTNLAGIDPETGKLSRLFHPRVDIWTEHFRWEGAFLRGLTEVGRATIEVLQINRPSRVQFRRRIAK